MSTETYTPNDYWSNDGIPLTREKTLYSLIEILLQPYQTTTEDGLVTGTWDITTTEDVIARSEFGRLGDSLESVYAQQHIATATNSSLDKFGQLLGVNRKTGESDQKFRARIRAIFAASIDSSTHTEIVELFATILGVSVNAISLEYNVSDEPVAIMSLPTDAIENSTLNVTDITELVNSVVAASHRIDVVQRGSFTVRDAAETNDPTKGLIAVGETGGGTLASGSL